MEAVWPFAAVTSLTGLALTIAGTSGAWTATGTGFLAGGLKIGDVFRITAGTGFTVRLKLNSTNNFATATTIATATTTSAFNPYSTMQRHFEIKSSLLQGFIGTVSAFTDYVQNSNARISTAITTSADFYLYVSIQPTSTTESYQVTSVQITN